MRVSHRRENAGLPREGSELENTVFGDFIDSYAPPTQMFRREVLHIEWPPVSDRQDNEGP